MTDVELVPRYLAFRDQPYMARGAPGQEAKTIPDKQMLLGAGCTAKNYKKAEVDPKKALAISVP